MALPVGPKISPFSSAGVCGRVRAARRRGLSRKDRLHLVPQRVDDGLVLAGIGNALVHRLAEIDPVVEQLVEEALVDRHCPASFHAFGGERPAPAWSPSPLRTKRSKIFRTVAASPR
jgi:hypothetical protein